MLKELIAIVDSAEEAAPFLKKAVEFADAQEARLAVTVLSKDLVSLVATSPFGIFPVPFDEMAEDQQAVLEQVRSHLPRSDTPVEVRGVMEDPTLLRGVSRVEGRYADVLLLGSSTSYVDHKLRRRLIETALMSSGGPVLVFPESGSIGRVRYAVVGWNASGEARRALRDLMDIIEPGGKIDVVVVDPEPSPLGHGPSPGADIAHLLARHGYEVDVVQESSVGRSEAEALEGYVLDKGADLLAIGAFAHSRVRDILLGGVTNKLVEGNRVPVLLSR